MQCTNKTKLRFTSEFVQFSSNLRNDRAGLISHEMDAFLKFLWNFSESLDFCGILQDDFRILFKGMGGC